MNKGIQKHTSIIVTISYFLLLIISELNGSTIHYIRNSRAAPNASSIISYDEEVEMVPKIVKNLTGKPTSENVTGQLGASVFLACRTHHSMERQFVPQVSWVRRSDWHILTSGTLLYTKEERFLVHHPEGSTEWTLEIKYLKLIDEGTYECQISTGGGILSHLVNLKIVAPKAVIPGNGEYHVETGSTITLDCIIEQSPLPPQFIFWYQKDRMINYDNERGGVTVNIDTESSPVRSRLSITDARSSDSGNYTCAAANTAPSSVMVYITEANKIAVIQPQAVDLASSMEPQRIYFFFISSFTVVCFNLVWSALLIAPL